MAKKRKRTNEADELLLFSPLAMSGGETDTPEETRSAEREETVAVAPLDREEKPLDSDIVDPERLTTEMTVALEYLDTLNTGQIRMIAMETASLWHNGVKMNGKYQIQTVPGRTIDGYKFLAFYYCSFFKVFPNMMDKLNLPYEDICRRAIERYNSYRIRK